MKKMFLAILKKIKEHKFAFILSVIFFILPFFWLKPGEMDLGGDANRLYFYDPISFLKSTALYVVAREGKGIVEPRFFYFPYIAFIAIIKLFISSPTYLISFFNGLKLAVGFLSIYAIVIEFSKDTKIVKNFLIHQSAILAGIFYVVSFGSFHMAFFWDRPLFTHDQIFLNPLLFYLFLKFFTTHLYKYLWIALLITFIFSTNFSLLGSAPPLFAFYPIAMLFLCLYTKCFEKRAIPWKGVLIGLVFFIGLHAFHLLVEVLSFIDSGSNANSLVFSKKGIENEGVTYFNAVHYHGQAIINLLLPSESKYFIWSSFIAPVILIFGFLLSKKNKKFLFISLFFFLTFFLATANITNLGFEIYVRLFYIPGFVMFRNFYTQWLYIFIFFYSILLGMSIYSIIIKLKPYYAKIFFVSLLVIFIITGSPLLLGWVVNKATIRGSNNIKTTIRMDPQYEQTLTFIRNLPDDGKIMVFPLTDFFRQVVSGKQGGAYEGPSTLLALTNKYSFVGYQHFGYKDKTSYAEDIMKYAREKKYDRLLNIFTTLNIRYILYNSDPLAYEKGFIPGPFGYMMTSLPKTQAGYKKLLSKFPLKKIYENGPYILYEIDPSYYNTTVFIPNEVYLSDVLKFNKNKSHSVFISHETCKKSAMSGLCIATYHPAPVAMETTMINPTMYKIHVKKNQATKALLLVLQHTYHSGWNMYIDNKQISQKRHIRVNGYANGWYLHENDIPQEKEFTILIMLDSQKYFWYGWSITIVFLFGTISLFIVSVFKKDEKNE